MKVIFKILIALLFLTQSLIKANDVDTNTFPRENPFSENVFDDQSMIGPPPPPDDGGGGTVGTGESVSIDMFVLFLFFGAVLIILFHKKSFIQINVAKKRK